MKVPGFIKHLYINSQLLYFIIGIALLFFLSYWVHPLYTIAWICAFILAIFLICDAFILFLVKDGIQASRILPERFSNSDFNSVPVHIQNQYHFKISIDVIDELPFQFQKRDFFKTANIQKGDQFQFTYDIRPVERGVYHYGNLNVYVSSPLRILRRKFTFQNQQTVAVYPSFVQMKKFDFLSIQSKVPFHGLKKIRRIGQTMEFEQIKEYIPGDDFRTINWKATAKKSELMVNQYQDEKSQPILSVIDTGRVMKMPFNHLSLLDYAINSSLAFSNVALKKKDRVGLATFNKKVVDFIAPSSKNTHLNMLLEKLYAIDTEFPDSDFGNLYGYLKRKVTQRSLLFLYTNFEHISALKRQLPFLQAIAKKHVLVVVFFENTELESLIKTETNSVQDIFHKTIAEKFANDKKIMLRELHFHGIQAILTAPENLTVNTINKYLEIKARGLL